MKTREKLYFRRQYLFTNSETTPLPYWKEQKVSFKNKVSTLVYHPDLEFTKSDNRLNVILLGYILDPFNTLAGNQDIVDSLAQCEDIQAAFRKTDFCNGRYVMIISDNDHQYVINDATASKQVYYLFKDDGTFAIGSTPNIITSYIDCAKTDNQELLNYLYSDRYIKQNKSWFGTETPFKDIFLLLPNHYLNIDKKNYERFWPLKKAATKETKESIRYIAEIMKGTIESASNRYKLHVSLTGGWDTRMILAASKSRIAEIEFYTFINKNYSKKDISDIEIPKKLSKRFQLNHNFIILDGSLPDEEFVEIYGLNSIFNRNVYREVYHKYLQNDHDKKMNVTGIMGDQILRIFYRFEGEITAEKFAHKFHELNNPYILKSIRKWIDQVKPLIQDFDYHIIDWFNWEHYFGNWGGLSASEHDIARDELRIFNCRELLSTFMRIDNKLRYRDNPKANRMIIEHNWRELLSEKVEPSNIQYRALKKVLRFLNLEQSADKVYRFSKYKFSDFKE